MPGHTPPPKPTHPGAHAARVRRPLHDRQCSLPAPRRGATPTPTAVRPRREQNTARAGGGPRCRFPDHACGCGIPQSSGLARISPRSLHHACGCGIAQSSGLARISPRSLHHACGCGIAQSSGLARISPRSLHRACGCGIWNDRIAGLINTTPTLSTHPPRPTSPLACGCGTAQDTIHHEWFLSENWTARPRTGRPISPLQPRACGCGTTSLIHTTRTSPASSVPPCTPAPIACGCETEHQAGTSRQKARNPAATCPELGHPLQRATHASIPPRAQTRTAKPPPATTSPAPVATRYPRAPWTQDHPRYQTHRRRNTRNEQRQPDKTCGRGPTAQGGQRDPSSPAPPRRQAVSRCHGRHPRRRNDRPNLPRKHTADLCRPPAESGRCRQRPPDGTGHTGT